MGLLNQPPTPLITLSVTTFLRMLMGVQRVMLCLYNFRGAKPANDYHPDVGLMVVGGLLCGTGESWCGLGTNKTLLSSDGGVTFSELAELPGPTRKSTCGVFLDENTFMVIGGKGTAVAGKAMNSTWLYDVGSDTWSEGPAMSQARKQGCNSICNFRPRIRPRTWPRLVVP